MRKAMRVSFTKMHGLGNDFIILDGREKALPALASQMVRALSDRKTGIGCDQLIALEPSTNADFRMRIFNSDGGEVEACGNASRAVALLHGDAARVETSGGMIKVAPADMGARVDMGIPRFEWDAIPLAYAMDTLSMPVGWDTLENPVGISVGNPHVVFFVDNADDIALDQLGPVIEHDPLFPERVNVNVASLTSENALKLHVWERGVGLTRACGTGACATAVSAMRRGMTARAVDVSLPGGTLAIEWDDKDRIIMTGPASESYRGSFEWDDFA